MTRAEKRAAKIADERINRAYMATCAGIQINIMEIGNVFKYGRLIIAEGADDESLRRRIRSYVETIRQN